MLPAPSLAPLLSGRAEAELYHHVADRGFFAVLWAAPAPVEPALRNAAEQRSASHDPPPKVQRCYRLSELPQVIAALDPTRDTWISQAEFIQPQRRLVYLLRLSLCFVDLDTYKTPWAGTAPEALAHRVWGYCLDDDLPAPSLILYSGRGLQVKWLLERPLPRAALPRWNAVQKVLVERLERFGADPGARDAARLLRLVDTVNTRSGERVRVLWVNERGGVIQRYDFEYLAEMLLPVARATIREERPAKAERRARLTVIPGSKTGNLRAFSGRQLAWDRLEDLRTLARLRGWTEHGIPHGYRSKYIHWCLNFLLLSGAAHSSQLFQEAQALVREVCPDFTKEVRSVLSTLYRKAQAYEAGEKIEFGGKDYPPLYTPKNSTLRELFAITDAETAHLKTLLTPAQAAEREAERKRNERRRSGTVDRETYLQEVKETAEQRRAHARLLRARGLTWAEVGQEMGGISATAARLLAER